jgi:hypothetical protein
VSTFFLMVPGYWAKTNSATAAWNYIRRESGRSRHDLRRGQFFMLEFAQPAAEIKIEVDDVTGAWRTDKYPVRVVEHHLVPKEQLKTWLQWCEEGLTRWAESQGVQVKR